MRGVSLESVKSKFITNEESSLKLALKANIAREQIPEEYKAKAGDKLTSLKVKSEKAQTNIRNEQSKSVNKTYSIKTKTSIENNILAASLKSKTSIRVGAEAKAVSTKSRAEFNFNAELDLKIKNDPNPPYKQKIKKLRSDKKRSCKRSRLKKKSKALSQLRTNAVRGIYVAMKKTKPMMESINKKMAEMKTGAAPKRKAKA